MTTATQTALALVRDDSVTFEQLARHFGASEAFVAGLVECVTGNADWRDADTEPSEAEHADYQRGFQLGQTLVETEALADGWAECYALALVEALRAAEQLPVVTADEIPW